MSYYPEYFGVIQPGHENETLWCKHLSWLDQSILLCLLVFIFVNLNTLWSLKYQKQAQKNPQFQWKSSTQAWTIDLERRSAWFRKKMTDFDIQQHPSFNVNYCVTYLWRFSVNKIMVSSMECVAYTGNWNWLCFLKVATGNLISPLKILNNVY